MGSYIPVNLFLFLVDALTGGGWWFYWVTIIWGIVLVIQAVNVFGPFSQMFDEQWEERKIRELMAQEEKPKRLASDLPEDDYFEKS